MSVPDDKDGGTSALLADETALLRARLRMTLLLCLAPILTFGIFDLYLAPDMLEEGYAIKLIAVAVTLGTFALLGPQRSHAFVVILGLACVAVMYLLSTLSAIIGRESATTPILSIAVALGTATLLPWGVGPQIVVVVIATASTLAVTYGVTGSLAPLLAYPTIGVAIGLGLSVYVAAEFERSRRMLARRQRDQQLAEAEVRQLNEVLEARVIERTEQLERLNQQLQRSEAALSALIENASDAIWSIDRHYRLTAFNSVVRRRFAELFGVAPHLERDFGARVAPPLQAEFKAHYDRGLAGERFTIEHSVDGPSGRRYFVTSFNPIVTAGAVGGLAIFSNDVTDRTRAEAAARQHHAELTHVLRLSTMGEMAAGLAHEINQPLAAIVNYAQGCTRRLRANPGDVAVVLPVLDDLATEALRAGEIIRRLRTLIRKEAPRQEWTQVNDVVGDAVRLLEPEARHHQVEVRLQLDPDLPPVLGDAIQLEQVVLNLVRNAIEAMADGEQRRELDVRTARAGDDAIEVSVRDTGPGLSAAAAEHVFDPFFSTKQGGLGMGLSISRTIIESHHGTLWATGNADGGSCFRFRLPVAAGAATFTSAAM